MRWIATRSSRWSSPAIFTIAVLIVLVVAAIALTSWLPSSTARAPGVSPSSTPSAAETPHALGPASDAGGVIFATEKGVWRYDGARGTVARLGARGRPTADKRQYVVIGDDARLYLADAASGSIGELAPGGAIDADWIGGGKPMVFIDSETLTWYLGARSQAVAVTGARYVRLSPDGRRALIGLVSAGANVDALGLVELSSLVLRNVLSVPPTQAISPASWSPDSRFFSYFVHNSALGLSVELRVVDMDTGTVADLGPTLGGSSDVSWAGPHMLAYVAGSDPQTWSNKTLRIWTPEGGVRDITGPNEIGLNPSWSADGRTLYFIRSAVAYHDPVEFLAGRATGDRRVAVFDLASGTVSTFPAQLGDVSEGVRVATSGTLLLRVSRPRVAVASAVGAAVSLDLSLLDLSSHQVTLLAQIGASASLGRYDSPEAMAWSR